MVVPSNPPAYVSLQPAGTSLEEASFNLEGKRYVVSLRGAKTDSQRTLFEKVQTKDFSAIINLFDGLLPAERQPFLINYEQATRSDLLLGLARRGISRDTLKGLCESVFGSRSWDAALAWEDVTKAVQNKEPGIEGKFCVAQFFTKGSENQPEGAIASYERISKIYRALRCLENGETTLAHDLLEIRRSCPESSEISRGVMDLLRARHEWLSAGRAGSEEARSCAEEPKIIAIDQYIERPYSDNRVENCPGRRCLPTPVTSPVPTYPNCSEIS